MIKEKVNKREWKIKKIDERNKEIESRTREWRKIEKMYERESIYFLFSQFFCPGRGGGGGQKLSRLWFSQISAKKGFLANILHNLPNFSPIPFARNLISIHIILSKSTH